MTNSNSEKKLPLVVIFGRTNVGKSTLFNCLTESRQALTSAAPGTTRDYSIRRISWNGRDMNLADTGGIIDLHRPRQNRTAVDIDAQAQKQARRLLERADLILFLVDVKSGTLPIDKELALYLKKIIPQTEKRVILAANKADKPSLRLQTADFNRLGLGEPMPLSAANGSGTGDLLDLLVSKLPKKGGGKQRVFRPTFRKKTKKMIRSRRALSAYRSSASRMSANQAWSTRSWEKTA